MGIIDELNVQKFKLNIKYLYLNILFAYFKKKMESLFEKNTTQKFVERINQLSPQTQAQWGKMRVEQMLWHCQKPFEIASGTLVPKINPLIKFLFGKSAKRDMTGEKPVKKSLPTFNEAKAIQSAVFEKEKKNLIAAIENFQQKGLEGLTKKPHPFFGEMNVTEWNALLFKHLDHHLTQFGV